MNAANNEDFMMYQSEENLTYLIILHASEMFLFSSYNHLEDDALYLQQAWF